MNKAVKILMMAILIAAMLLPLTAAIGVSPGRTTIDFVPNAEHELSFDIINDQGKDMRVMLEIEGDADNTDIYLEKKVIEIKAGESRKHIDYRARLPEMFKSPGTKEIRISIIPMIDEKSDQPLQINTMVGVITQLRIKVPEKGKYLSATGIEIEPGSKETATTFLIPVSNIGTERIGSVKANITITNPSGKAIATLQTQEIAVESKGSAVLKAVWSGERDEGRYNANAVIMYDSKSITLEKAFNVGQAAIEILGITAKNFRLGQIAKIELWLKSNWNEILNIYGQMVVKKPNMDIAADIKTASSDIEPGKEGSLTAYWDTEGIEEGKYYVTLKIYYGKDAYVEKQFEAVLALDSISFSPLGVTGQVVSAESGNKSIIVFLVLILIGINIGWIIYKKRKKQ
ncbi:MAG: hypothetical protein KJ955_00600 [Nanoarchaeota archaeon]|nr:hypothetical protein [Nanoarchaeota archaeon]